MKYPFTSIWLTNLRSLTIPRCWMWRGSHTHSWWKLKNHVMLSWKVECLHTQQIQSVYIQFLWGHSSEESACQCRRHRKHRFDPWVEEIPWRRKWQPTPVFLPGKSHRQRSLAGYSPRGPKESDRTEDLSTRAECNRCPSKNNCSDSLLSAN